MPRPAPPPSTLAEIETEIEPTSGGGWGRLAAMRGVAGVAVGGGAAGEATALKRQASIASLAKAVRINARIERRLKAEGASINLKMEARLKARLAAPLTPAQLATQAKRRKMQELRWRHPQVNP